jgi:hypothetical protein
VVGHRHSPAPRKPTTADPPTEPERTVFSCSGAAVRYWQFPSLSRPPPDSPAEPSERSFPAPGALTRYRQFLLPSRPPPDSSHRTWVDGPFLRRDPPRYRRFLSFSRSLPGSPVEWSERFFLSRGARLAAGGSCRSRDHCQIHPPNGANGSFPPLRLWLATGDSVALMTTARSTRPSLTEHSFRAPGWPRSRRCRRALTVRVPQATGLVHRPSRVNGPFVRRRTLEFGAAGVH